MSKTAEEYHREAIREIHDRARREAEPHIQALVRIESSRPPKPTIATLGDGSQFLESYGVRQPKKEITE